MAEKSRPDFSLTGVYSTSQVAAMFERSTGWVKTNWIKTGRLQYMPAGTTELIAGQWILDMVLENGCYEGDEHAPPPTKRGKNPGSKSTLKQNQEAG